MENNVYKMKSFSKSLNDLTFTDYIYRLMLIARSVYKWENLPNHINEKWIEKFLFHHGYTVFFKDPKRGFMVSKAVLSGKINSYDEPTVLTPYGVDYQGEPLINGVDCVLIDNNDLRLPTLPTIELYAYRLAEISRTIDVNISAQKTPYIVTCSNRQRLTLKNVINQATDNELVIYGDNDLDVNGINVLKTNAPIVFPDLQTQKHAIWNECMTFLGVNNANMDKRERLVASEVDANNDQISISADVMLKSREEACKRINELWPELNVSVSLREDLNGALMDDSFMEGGEEDVC